MDEVDELAAQWGIEREFFDASGRLQRPDAKVIRQIASSLSAESSPSRFQEGGEPHRVAYQGDGHSRNWALAVQLYGIRSGSNWGDGHSRNWALAVQLYGIRSGSNWGHGDFGDLANLVTLAARSGAAGVGLNPLHALFPDRPEDASPYAPNSRLFLNPLYIDVGAAPGFAGLIETDLIQEVARLRDTTTVAYTAVARIKMAALRCAYSNFLRQPETLDDFESFRRERGNALARFAAFETLRGRYPGRVWWEWPKKWRRPSESALASLRSTAAHEIGFHEYIQWIADRQLRHCGELARSLGLAIGLYIDMAVGVEPGGADAWSGQGAMLNDLSVGAPPDLLNTLGQEWGVTTYNPHRLSKSEFAPFREMLRSAMRYAGAIRLDHILGLKRLYVIPRGLSATQGSYLRCPCEPLLDVVADESQKQQCIVIGEDLGTVPEGFRDTLAKWGIWTYLVMLFERDHDGSFRAPDRYPANALATFSTHDLAAFAGWLSGHDLQVKHSIGLDPGERDDERAHAIAALHEATKRFGLDGEGFVSIVRYLAATPSRLVAVSIEDVLGIEDQINVPGTIDQHPNWRRKLPATIEEIEKDPRLHRIADVFEQAGRANKR